MLPNLRSSATLSGLSVRGASHAPKTPWRAPTRALNQVPRTVGALMGPDPSARNARTRIKMHQPDASETPLCRFWRRRERPRADRIKTCPPRDGQAGRGTAILRRLSQSAARPHRGRFGLPPLPRRRQPVAGRENAPAIYGRHTFIPA